MSQHDTQYLRFVLANVQKPKTAVWLVLTKDSEKEDAGHELGQVRWFGRWRKYAFFPAMNTVYEQTCLRDLAAFCERETSAHRNRVKP